MDARGRLAKFTIQEHVTCVKGGSWHGGHGGTKKAHIARIGQKVAYFERCLIVISKDKITSYHIWKMFLQSFSHELGGEWRQRRLQHEDMERAKSKIM